MKRLLGIAVLIAALLAAPSFLSSYYLGLVTKMLIFALFSMSLDLLLAFVVVIIGGLGSLKGAFVGGLVVGLIDNFGKALVPEFALFTVFVPMAIILAIRPTGLFGRA